MDTDMDTDMELTDDRKRIDFLEDYYLKKHSLEMNGSSLFTLRHLGRFDSNLTLRNIVDILMEHKDKTP